MSLARRARAVPVWLGAALLAAGLGGGIAAFRCGGVADDSQGADDAVDVAGVRGRGRRLGSGRSGVPSRAADLAGVGKVVGQIADPSGAPVGGGRVVLRCLARDGRSGPVAGGIRPVDEDGRFEGPACDGTVCVEYQHATHAATEPWTAARGDDVQWVARPRARIWGEVHDADGAPVVDATVVMAMADETDPSTLLPTVSSRTSTDADGVFSLARRAAPPCDPCRAAAHGCAAPLATADRVMFSARARGYGPARVAVRLVAADDPAADDPVVVVLPAPEPAIGGTLTDAGGEPLPRAFVLAQSELRPDEQHRGAVIDGAFSIEDLGPGTYALRAIQDETPWAVAAGVAPGGTVALVAEAPGMPRDLVVELVQDGAPLAGASVRGGPFGRGVTDSSGQVRAKRVLPGTYTVQVVPPRDDAGNRSRRVSIVVQPATGAAPDVQHAVVDPW